MSTLQKDLESQLNQGVTTSVVVRSPLQPITSRPSIAVDRDDIRQGRGFQSDRSSLESRSPSTDTGASLRMGTGQATGLQMAPVSLGTQSPTDNPELNDNTSDGVMVFPSTVAPYHLQLFFAQYNPKKALDGSKWAKTDFSVTLPLPANLLTNTALDYSNVNLGAIGGELLGVARELVGSDDFFATLNSQIQNGLTTATGGNASSSDLRTVLLRRLLSVNQTVAAGVDLIDGSTPNPHVGVTFNNVRLRTFSFTWRLSPSSAEESEQLHKIVRTINKRILPSKRSQFLLRYPNQCLLALRPEPLNDLFQFKPCVMTDMTVNYAPSGIPSFFKDQRPTEVQLSMSFQEIQIRTAEDYK